MKGNQVINKPIKNKVKLGIGYFPPYSKYYISASSHTDDYYAYGHIRRFNPQYFKELEEAKKEMTEFIEQHSEDYEAA